VLPKPVEGEPSPSRTGRASKKKLVESQDSIAKEHFKSHLAFAGPSARRSLFLALSDPEQCALGLAERTLLLQFVDTARQNNERLGPRVRQAERIARSFDGLSQMTSLQDILLLPLKDSDDKPATSGSDSSSTEDESDRDSTTEPIEDVFPPSAMQRTFESAMQSLESAAQYISPQCIAGICRARSTLQMAISLGSVLGIRTHDLPITPNRKDPAVESVVAQLQSMSRAQRLGVLERVAISASEYCTKAMRSMQKAGELERHKHQVASGILDPATAAVSKRAIRKLKRFEPVTSAHGAQDDALPDPVWAAEHILGAKGFAKLLREISQSKPLRNCTIFVIEDDCFDE